MYYGNKLWVKRSPQNTIENSYQVLYRITSLNWTSFFSSLFCFVILVKISITGGFYWLIFVRLFFIAFKKQRFHIILWAWHFHFCHFFVLFRFFIISYKKKMNDTPMREKPDFSVYHMEDGTVVNTKERIYTRNNEFIK